jgi:hypothetical protein
MGRSIAQGKKIVNGLVRLSVKPAALCYHIRQKAVAHNFRGCYTNPMFPAAAAAKTENRPAPEADTAVFADPALTSTDFNPQSTDSDLQSTDSDPQSMDINLLSSPRVTAGTERRIPNNGKE